MTALLSIEQLHIYHRDKLLVSIADFDIQAGEILGLVGESGSGKSLAAKALLGLLPKSLTVSGSVLHQGKPLPLSQQRTSQSMAAIFQHPAGSFTPVVTIGAQINEVIRCHSHFNRSAAKVQSLLLLQRMGLDDCERVYRAYPQQLSGGMLQRAAIAMALACQPTLLIADEPTTALDSLTQTEVLDLLQRLRAEESLSVLLISHDMPLVAQYSEQVAVMRHGEIVERGAAAQVLSNPAHSYTQQLLAARPDIFASYTPTSRLTSGGDR